MLDPWLLYLDFADTHPQFFKNDGPLKIIFNSKKVLDYEKNHPGVVIGMVYRSSWHVVLVDLVYNGSDYFAYERVVPVSQGAVVIVPIYNDKFVLLRQFRHAIRRSGFAFPRGFGDSSMVPMENAYREVCEELGITKDNIHGMTFLGKVHPDSGFLADTVNVYCCQINKYSIRKGYEGIQNVSLFSFYDLASAVYRGEIQDGFTLASLSLCHSFTEK